MSEPNKEEIRDEVESVGSSVTGEATATAAASSSSASAAASSSSSKKADPEKVAGIKELLRGMNLSAAERKTAEHRFWDTQPVAKMDENVTEENIGPREGADKEVRQTPYALPKGFEWCDVDMDDETESNDAFKLLASAYVEDNDGMFRFEYQLPFLQWALKPPGYRKDWHIGVRGEKKKNLLAFITAIPADIRVRGETIKMVEINFLCVHKKLRAKRLAPVLIMEITRRVNLTGVFQAVYTAGVELPKPVTCARYYHRTLNPRKLVDVGFTSIPRNSTMKRMQVKYRLPETTEFPFAPLEQRDVPEVTAMLAGYLSEFVVSPAMSEADVSHWLTPRDEVIFSYVLRYSDWRAKEEAERKAKDGKGKKKGASEQESNVPESVDGNDVEAVVSFYNLPSQVLRHERHKELKAAYCFYSCARNLPRETILNDALILAKKNGFDVFNALNIQDNSAKLLGDLKFGIGDGDLHYYLYNYFHPQINPSETGLILM